MTLSFKRLLAYLVHFYFYILWFLLYTNLYGFFCSIYFNNFNLLNAFQAFHLLRHLGNYCNISFILKSLVRFSVIHLRYRSCSKNVVSFVVDFKKFLFDFILLDTDLVSMKLASFIIYLSCFIRHHWSRFFFFKFGGVILAKICTRDTDVGFKHPIIMWLLSFKAIYTFFM